MKPRSKFYKQVHIELLKRDMSIADLARALGLDRSYVTAVVTGGQYSRSCVLKICEYLNIPEPKRIDLVPPSESDFKAKRSKTE